MLSVQQWLWSRWPCSNSSCKSQCVVRSGRQCCRLESHCKVRPLTTAITGNETRTLGWRVEGGEANDISPVCLYKRADASISTAVCYHKILQCKQQSALFSHSTFPLNVNVRRSQNASKTADCRFHERSVFYHSSNNECLYSSANFGCNLRKLTIFFPKLQQSHTVLLTAAITDDLHETLQRD